MSTELAAEEAQKKRAIDQHSRQADQFEARYAQPAEEDYRSCFNYSRKRLDALLERYLPAEGGGRRLLDVGCGTGHHMARLAARGYEVAGVDGSPEMLAHARTRNPGAVVELGPVDRLPFPDASFDVVLCIEVLRYLPEPAGCVREMARVLRPGGTCLTTAVPPLNLNGYWLVNRVAEALPVRNMVRLRQYFESPRALSTLFGQAGFARVDVHGVYGGPVNWVERLLPFALPALLRGWEGVDRWLWDRPLLRDFSNMLLVHAVRGS